MKFIIHTFIFALCFLGSAISAPTTSNSEKLIITEEFFPDSFVVHTAEHDIVSIVVPLNLLNLNDDEDDNDSFDDDLSSNSSKSVLFFVLADIKDNGEKDFKGLYYMNNTITKLILENGTEATTQFGKNKNAYFAAKDGIYTYNADKIEAEKFGSVADNLIGIAVENGSDTLYVLNVKHELYKVTEKGTQKTKVKEDVEEFVLDFANNLYFYGKDKIPYIITKNGTSKIEGLPANKSFIKLLRPAFIVDQGVYIIVNNNTFVIYSNGTIEETGIELKVRPTASALDATILQYYAHNKKIYEYNLIVLILLDILEGFKEFFEGMQDGIQSIASKSQKEFGLFSN